MKYLTGLRQSRLWWALALEDIRSRYMRSFMGIGWVIISFALFVVVKIVVFTPLSSEDTSHFANYIVIGFFIWNFIAMSLVDGCTAFINAQSWIKGMKIPLSVFVYQVVTKNVLLNIVNLGVVFVTMLIFRPELTWVALWALPFTLLLIINAIWVSFLFSTLGARFRDVQHLVTTIMRVLMFLTPILWMPEDIGALWEILKYNPFAHYIILIRAPILQGIIPMDSLYYVLGITLAGSLAAIIAYQYGRKRVVFWL